MDGKWVIGKKANEKRKFLKKERTESAMFLMTFLAKLHKLGTE